MKIGYLPAGNRALASSRLRVFKIADELTKLGHTVVFEPDTPDGLDVLVVQKRADCEGILRDCRDARVRTVFDVDDWLRLDTRYADVVTVDTHAKLELYPQALVIPDALDIEPDSPRKTVHAHTLKRVVFVSNPENVYHVQYAAEACDTLGIDLTVITNLEKLDVGGSYSVHGVHWTLENVDAELVEHDLLIAPFVLQDGRWSPEWVRSKSANRILKAWALGLPVAATPIPSYVEAGLQYAALSVPEWVGVLTALQGLPARVVDATRGALRSTPFRAEVVAQRWLQVFGGA